MIILGESQLKHLFKSILNNHSTFSLNTILKIFLIVAVVLLSFNTETFAQTKLNAPVNPVPFTELRCNTTSGLAWRLANDPVYNSFHQNAMNIPAMATQPTNNILCDAGNTITVPVAFHFDAGFDCTDVACVLPILQDQLAVLNTGFGNNVGVLDAQGNDPAALCPMAYPDVSTGTCIDFCFAIPPAGGAAGLDPACDPPITFGVFNGGINAGGMGAPGWDGILNIFITTGNCLGVADGIPGAANGDGVTVCAGAFGGLGPAAPGCGTGLDDEFPNQYDLGATLVHEIGHYLGLFHVHQDFGGGCAGGDNDMNAPGPFMVNDTPLMTAAFFGCPANGACQFNADAGCNTAPIPIANYMAFTDDGCMTMFTEDQAMVMNFWANQLFGPNNSICGNQTPTELTSACEMQSCIASCPTEVITPIAETNEFCSVSPVVDFPDPLTLGLMVDDASDLVFVWSTGGFINTGGTVVTMPAAMMSTNCSMESETYFLNVDCGSTPISPPFEGGTYTITVFPGPPADITTLVTISGEGTCDEPMVVPIEGCENFVTITPDPNNPTFPVASGQSGTAAYTIEFVSDPQGPECCVTPMAGELIINGPTATQNQDGDLENGGMGWTTTSTNFGTVFCNTGTCGNGGGSVNYGVPPNSGTELAWFGGIGAFEAGTLSTDVVIPVCLNGDAVMTFAYENSVCGSSDDFIELLVDGTQVWIDNTDPANCDPNGTINLITVSLAAFADGSSHNISFNSESGNGGVASNFTIDNILLETVGCSVESNCEALVTASYNCDVMIELEQDLTASDPCSCNNDQSANGAGDGTFSESVVITGTPGLELCAGPGSSGIIDPATGMDVSGAFPAFVEGPAGTYTLSFNHIDATGFVVQFFDCAANTVLDIDVNGSDESEISNICYYPIITLAVADPFCDTDGPVDLSGTVTNDMPDGATSFGGSFVYTGPGVTASGDQFDPSSVGAGTYTITAEYTPAVLVGTNVDPAGDVCLTSIDVMIEVVEAEVSFDCPSGFICAGAGIVDLNPMPVGGVWSGTGSSLVTAANTIDLSTLSIGDTFTLIYTTTDANGCGGSEMCSFTITTDCPANAGAW